jgi:hypothetical protein
LAILSIALLASCSPSEQTSNQPAAEPSEPPFSNAEPESYQAIVVQSSPGGTVKFLIARDGDRWRIDSEYGLPSQTGSLHVDKKDFVLDFATRSYSEYTAGHGFDERPGMVEEISFGLLNSRETANYEMVATEGELTRYRMIDGKGKEAIITIDTSKDIPVKKEIYDLADGGRQLTMTVTLEDLRLEPDQANFDLPKDFKQVPIGDMKKILTGGK